MTSSIRRLQIRNAAFASCPELQTPLNDALVCLQDNLALATEGVVLLRLQPQAVDLYVDSNTPGSPPWPLRLAKTAGAPIGAVLLRVENLTDSGPSGVPTSAVGITTQRVEGGTVFVDFISGLTVGSRYRFRFGVYDNA